MRRATSRDRPLAAPPSPAIRRRSAGDSRLARARPPRRPKAAAIAVVLFMGYLYLPLSIFTRNLTASEGAGGYTSPVSLTIGSRIGPFEIIGPLGAGGMGEVYRAVDANLGRSVAVKVLPDAFALDPERLARFERKAKTLASLNHPNIAQVFGLERGGADLRMRALVMELVEGPTLADRIAKGPIPLDEAVPIAIQIAEALESAHELGIVHRDLKPANVKVRDDGTVRHHSRCRQRRPRSGCV